MDEKTELRKELELKYGKKNVFDTNEVQQHFTIDSFLAPFCFGIRKSTDEKVTLTFNHMPRLYWLSE